MRLILVAFISFLYINTNAQCKTYKLTKRGDTINCIDQQDQKQGKWKIAVEALRGNPGYEEEGEFVDNRKEGTWRRYNLMGDLIAVLNFKWGNYDGFCQYFTIAGIEREESWRAMNPKYAYDTIMVEDVNDENKYIPVIVPNDGKSLKHGVWTWYRPGGEGIMKTETYFMGKLKIPGEENQNNGANTEAKKEETKEKPKPKEVEDYEKKNKGKKAVKTRDGRTG